MTKDQVLAIQERLELYEGIEPDRAIALIGHIEQALGIAPDQSFVYMAESDHEAGLEAEYSKGHAAGFREGYCDALDHVQARPVLSDDPVVAVECKNLRIALIDRQ